MKKKTKIILILSLCVFVAACGVAAALFLNVASPKTMRAQTVSEALEMAQKNGFTGDEEDWVRIITADNDTRQKGIANVYVNAHKQLMIVMENGVSVNAGDANEAVGTLKQQKTGMVVLKKGGENGAAGQAHSDNVIFKVVFKNDDATVLKTEYVIQGKSATPPLQPKKQGFVFAGWNLPYSNVQKDLVVKAQFETNNHPTITLTDICVKEGTRTAVVNVEVANNPGIASFVLDIHYPQEIKLKDVSFHQSNLGNALATAAKPFANPQRISVIGSTEAITANGVFAALTFELPQNTVTDYSGVITATYHEDNIFDMDLNNVSFDTIDAKVLINKQK